MWNIILKSLHQHIDTSKSDEKFIDTYIYTRNDITNNPTNKTFSSNEGNDDDVITCQSKNIVRNYEDFNDDNNVSNNTDGNKML